MSTRYLISPFAILYPSSDRDSWIWDDYYHHQKHKVTTTALTVINAANGSTVVETLDKLGNSGVSAEVSAAILHKAISSRLLVVAGSPLDLKGRRMESEWAEYGTLAQAFHYASRTLVETPFISVREDVANLLEKAQTSPPPAPFLELSHLDYQRLPSENEQLALKDTSLMCALERRRTTRDFRRIPVPLEKLSALLQTCCQPQARSGLNANNPSPLNAYFKVVPSGGARHPTEWYVNVTNVDGVAPGAYHYHARSHALGLVGPPLEGPRLVKASGGQSWLAGSSFQVLLVCQTERSRWKYDMARAYRAVSMDVGAILQAAFMVSVGLSLDMAFIGAFRDEVWELAFELDPVTQLSLGVMAYGLSDPEPQT